MNGTVTIYGLIDPRDHTMRYVGGTADLLAVRARNHGNDMCGRRLRKWVRQLGALGLRPVMVTLTQADYTQAAEMERRCIRAYAEGGARLLNTNDNPTYRRWQPPGEEPPYQRRSRQGQSKAPRWTSKGATDAASRAELAS